MSKKFRIAILVVLVLIAVVIVAIAINSNNTASAKNEQPTPEVRIVYVTVTPAPEAENTKTPVKENVSGFNLAMSPVTTAPTVVGASTKVEVTKAPVKELVSSSEISRKTIVTDTQGNLRQMMILAEDLSKVDYEEVVIDVWNGVELLSNDKGIVGEIFGKEAKADSQLRAGQRDEKLIKNFFVDGKVLSQKAREGYAVAGTTVGFYQNLTNVKFVKLEGENHYRLVVIGKATNKGGNSKTTAKPAPTATPRIPEEAATPRIPEATMPPEEVATPRIPDMDMPTEVSATAAPTIGGDDVAEPSIGGEDSSDWDI